MDKGKEIISVLQELLTEKKSALGIIYEMTLKQKEDIEKNEGENLDKYIDNKQEQIDAIDKLDRRFDSLYGKFKKDVGVESSDELDLKLYPEFKIIKSQIEDIMELGRLTMELELQNKNSIELLMEGLKNDIKKVKLGQKSINAYDRQIVNADGIYIDKKK